MHVYRTNYVKYAYTLPLEDFRLFSKLQSTHRRRMPATSGVVCAANKMALRMLRCKSCCRLSTWFFPRRTHSSYHFGKLNAFRREMNSSSAEKKGEEEDEQRVPVLIVGAGPVGLALSLLLDKYGVRCSVIDRICQPRNHPQAHFINNRTMEVFRKLDGLANDIEALQPPLEEWRRFIYCTSLSGTILGTVDHMQPHDLNQTRSPTGVAHFSQHRLVPLMLKKLQIRGFKLVGGNDKDDMFHDISSWIGTIRLRHECMSVNETSRGIRATVRCRHHSSEVLKTVLCDFLIGADGAGSTVRKFMNIRMNGEQALQNLISVHFFSKELGDFLLKDRPGMLYFVFNPFAIGVIIAHDLHGGEFVMQTPFYPPQQNFQDFTVKICRKLIVDLIGHDIMDIEVKSIKQWVMNAEVAEKYCCLGDRMLLVGDAAHRFPPAGGFGMNTGIQDAHNLAWKLASVIRGIACPGILRTYELERKPIAINNTALSTANFKAAMGVPAALGLDPAIANFVHKAINSDIASVVPRKLQTVLLESIFAAGRAQLLEPFMNRYNPFGFQRLEKVRHILERGQSLQLQFPAEDLGFRYNEGALIPEKVIRGENASHEKPSGRRREYIPSTMPGSRLPHMKIKPVSQNARFMNKEFVSTLDLISGNAVEFLLLIPPNEACYHWADAAFNVTELYNVRLLVCILWPRGTSQSQLSQKINHQNNSAQDTIKSIAKIESFPEKYRQKNLECVIDVEEASGSWWQLCKLSIPCATLVRPDDHIAWRSDPHFNGDFVDEMNEVFSKVLSKPKLSI